MKKSQQNFTLREKIVLGAMISQKIREAMNIEAYEMKPAATSEELRAIYKKVTGYEWRED